MPAAKGRIRGTVVAADTNAPLREAVVRLAGRDGGSARTTTTDADGRFELLAVPAGRYAVLASKAAYLTRQYAQRVEHVPGRPLELAEGQSLPPITIVLPKGGVVSGRILDQYGDALPDARIRVLRYERRAGRRRLVPAGRAAITDDLGQYRVYGLPPGEYFVGAGPGGSDEGEAGTPRVDGHAPTYYPGTTNLADAQPLAVAIAQDTLAEFPLVPARLVTVSGFVTTFSGARAVGGRVELRSRSDLASEAASLSRFSGPIGADGGFTIGPVAPGTYVIVAVAETGRTFGPFGAAEERQVGSAPLTVGNDPLTGASVATAPGATVVGRVAEDVGDVAGPSESLQVVATAANPDDPEADHRQIQPAPVRADRTFELRGLRGRYLLNVLGLPPRYALKGVYLGTRDITDDGVEAGSAARVSGLRVVVTSRVTDLSGTVHERDARPVRDYIVLACSDDRTRWTHPLARHTRVARPDQHGRYAITGLPPGEYWVVALADLEPGGAEDVDVLARLQESGSRVRLAAGEARVLDLELVRR